MTDYNDNMPLYLFFTVDGSWTFFHQIFLVANKTPKIINTLSLYHSTNFFKKVLKTLDFCAFSHYNIVVV